MEQLLDIQNVTKTFGKFVALNHAMTTISAVILLYTADTKLTSISIVNMTDAGDTAPAAAMSLIIVLTNILVRVVYEFATKKIRKRTKAWQQR